MFFIYYNIYTHMICPGCKLPVTLHPIVESLLQLYFGCLPLSFPWLLGVFCTFSLCFPLFRCCKACNVFSLWQRDTHYSQQSRAWQHDQQNLISSFWLVRPIYCLQPFGWASQPAEINLIKNQKQRLLKYQMKRTCRN